MSTEFNSSDLISSLSTSDSVSNLDTKGKYYCRICKKYSKQKGHHDTHLNSEAHKNQRKIFELELEKLSKGLNETTVSMNEILVKINEGSGTFGKMINDESLYTNMDSLTFNLNELIKNIQEDPKKYLKHMRLVEVF